MKHCWLHHSGPRAPTLACTRPRRTSTCPETHWSSSSSQLPRQQTSSRCWTTVSRASRWSAAPTVLCSRYGNFARAAKARPSATAASGSHPTSSSAAVRRPRTGSAASATKVWPPRGRKPLSLSFATRDPRVRALRSATGETWFWPREGAAPPELRQGPTHTPPVPARLLQWTPQSDLGLHCSPSRGHRVLVSRATQERALPQLGRKKSEDAYVQGNSAGVSSNLRLPGLSNILACGCTLSRLGNLGHMDAGRGRRATGPAHTWSATVTASSRPLYTLESTGAQGTCTRAPQAVFRTDRGDGMSARHVERDLLPDCTPTRTSPMIPAPGCMHNPRRLWGPREGAEGHSSGIPRAPCHKNRGWLADKRTVALPPARSLKKEWNPSFSASDGDSDGGGPACGRQPGLKQEDDPHVRIMKRSQDSDLPTLISSVHRSRHLVMPEHQSCCEFQRGSVEVGLRPTGGLLGKRLGCSPHVTSDCSSEKKAQSESESEYLRETLLLPELRPSMAPEDHYRQLVSALSEAGSSEEPQRLYHLGLPSHDLLRVQQEVAAAALRNPSGLEVHLPSSTAGQRQKQGLAQHRENRAPAPAFAPSFSERMPPTSSWAPISGPLSWGCHRLCARLQAEMLARQQKLLRKQNLAWLEMTPELLRQKELENTHRPQLLAPEAALCAPDSTEELQRHGAMLVLKHSSAPLLALPSQGVSGPEPPTSPREPAGRALQKGGPSSASVRPSESKETTASGLWAQDVSEEPPLRTQMERTWR
ncbi:sterile alpha motif domain-containing protein 11-like isoform X2 [Ictidomys tridecemlineatus]